MSNHQRIAECAERLRQAAVERGMVISGDGRVSEQDAAALLCLHPGSLKQMRQEGRAPTAHRAPMGGSRWSYSLSDISVWLEGLREGW